MIKLFEPLCERKYAIKFILVFIGLAFVFVAAAIITSLLSLKPFPGISGAVIGFAAIKAFSVFQATDYVLLVLFPLLAALLWVHYDHARCVPNGESKKSGVFGSTGVFLGLISAACPLCLIPLLGLTASAAVIAPIARGIKLVGLLLLVVALVFVIRKNACCALPGKPRKSSHES